MSQCLKPGTFREKAAVYQICCAYEVLHDKYPELPIVDCTSLFNILAFTAREAQYAAIQLVVMSLDKDLTIRNAGAVHATTVGKITGIHAIAESVVTGRSHAE